MPRIKPLFTASLLILAAASLGWSIFQDRQSVSTPPPQVQTQLQRAVETTSAEYPTLEDYWDGTADFSLQIESTGLPMGESETWIMQNGEWWSFVHASDRSAGTIDQCGDPVPFPGCTVIYKSQDEGLSFNHDQPPVCQFECQQCPCDLDLDQIGQQQYPRLFVESENQAYMVYEYLGRSMLRRSADGVTWSNPERVAQTGLWWLGEGCPPEEQIGAHPFAGIDRDQCLAGGPPGIYVENETIYIFVGLGQSPGGLGCYVGKTGTNPARFQRCRSNPLLTGSMEYGPLEVRGEAINAFWDFRMISSAEVIKIGETYYMLFEGIRGPGPGDAGDTQFGLGLARSTSGSIDGAWEMYPGNPILVDSPANIGIGHADLVITENGKTILFTSLDGEQRSRLTLEWGSP